MSSSDRPGRRTSNRGPRYARELLELREALSLPTVGHVPQEEELAELQRLVLRYPEETRVLLERRERFQRGE